MRLLPELTDAMSSFLIFSAINKDYFQDEVHEKIKLDLENVYARKLDEVNKDLDEIRTSLIESINNHKTKTIKDIEAARDESKRAVQGVAREFSVSAAVSQFETARTSLGPFSAAANNAAILCALTSTIWIIASLSDGIASRGK